MTLSSTVLILGKEQPSFFFFYNYNHLNGFVFVLASSHFLIVHFYVRVAWDMSVWMCQMWCGD